MLIFPVILQPVMNLRKLSRPKLSSGGHGELRWVETGHKLQQAREVRNE